MVRLENQASESPVRTIENGNISPPRREKVLGERIYHEVVTDFMLHTSYGVFCSNIVKKKIVVVDLSKGVSRGREFPEEQIRCRREFPEEQIPVLWSSQRLQQKSNRQSRPRFLILDTRTCSTDHSSASARNKVVEKWLPLCSPKSTAIWSP